MTAIGRSNAKSQRARHEKSSCLSLSGPGGGEKWESDFTAAGEAPHTGSENAITATRREAASTSTTDFSKNDRLTFRDGRLIRGQAFPRRHRQHLRAVAGGSGPPK
jgi:hypothetical protein